MMKRIIVLLIPVCMIAAVAVAQSAAMPATAQSATPQAAASQSSAPAAPQAKVRGKHAGRRPAARDIDDPRVKDLLTRHRNERKACKANPSGEGCSNLMTRQKSERRALMVQLRKEGKI